MMYATALTNETRHALAVLHRARAIQAADRLTAYTTRVRAWQREHNAVDTALQEVADLVETVLAMLNPHALAQQAQAALKAKRPRAGCCDFPDCGHTHDRQATVRLKTAWSERRPGTVLVMPQSLARGIVTLGFANFAR